MEHELVKLEKESSLLCESSEEGDLAALGACLVACSLLSASAPTLPQDRIVSLPIMRKMINRGTLRSSVGTPCA